MHLIPTRALWGEYYYYISPLFGGGNWDKLRLSNFSRVTQLVCGCAQLPFLAHITPLPFLISVLYHRELHFPASLALQFPGWFSQWQALMEAWGKGGEKPEYFSLSLSLLPVASLATAVSPVAPVSAPQALAPWSQLPSGNLMGF